jgi:LAS superfamily LD-carboxypeptidase LdcB
MRTRISAAAVVAALALVLAALAACGSDDSLSPTPVSPGVGTPSPAPATSPTPAVTPTPTVTEYVVQEGDTLFDIAQRFGTTAEAVAAANGISVDDTLQIGQVLIIPVDGTPASPATPTPTPTTGNGATSAPDLLRVVDKQNGLGSGYVPPGLVSIPAELMAPGFGSQLLRQVALDAMVQMLSAARNDGHDIRVRSAYRSYTEQQATFQYWIDQLGEEEARRVSAPPGHSEHQLGTAVDFTSASVGWQLSEAFAQTAEGQWMRANAPRFGFALSYPEDAEHITGYRFEPWHWRYIGRQHAEAWSAGNLTLVEYLRGLP